MNRSRKAFLHSLLALLLSISMLIGSTFAWFTDSVTTGSNIIQTGTLDLEMYWTDDLASGVWYNAEDPATNKVFDYDKWEPGYTEVRYLKLKNNGNLALNYELLMTPVGSVGKLAEVIQVYYDANGNPVDERGDVSGMAALGFLDRVMDKAVTANGTILPVGEVGLHPAGETVVTLAMQMITTAGNEYQDQSVGDGFTITALASQATYEADSNGTDYDNRAQYVYPEGYDFASAPVPSENNVTTAPVTLQGTIATATVPTGVKLEDGVDTLALTVRPKKGTDSGITTVDGEELTPIDVHIDGVAEDNTTPIIIDLGPVMAKSLNMGNLTLYHVEDGISKPMTLVSSREALTVHNTFTYDPATGDVSVGMATFSEVALVSETAAPWEGGRDYSWYDNANGYDYVITNADQLAGLSAIVGGMDGRKQDSFAGKTIKLAANINMGYTEDNANKAIFYPIGYYNSTGSYTKDQTISNVTSDVNSFEGIFDGQGYKISNIYQNTWSMFGDYNSGYEANSNHYDDAMGLFGYVVNGTVKNLTVDNFSSDGEFTPTGVLAAYATGATFENIAITNCNPRVYNTGNGGIVGIGGETADSATAAITFKNISVDKTNVITALWGSWDVACGGLMGMFRGPGHVYMTNCHVAAQIDVYNDVCGNYQYYRYRYAGMLIGTNKNMVTADGVTRPDISKFTTVGCTVAFDEWNDYYYCELVENSLASYTHDHQFSRLDIITNESDIQDENGAWNCTGNFYIVDTDTCYHIRKNDQGYYRHMHEASGTEDEKQIDEDKDDTIDLKEDKQRVYLPFNQLYTGYGWGKEHIPYTEDVEGVTILDGTTAKKFESKLGTNVIYRVPVDTPVKVGELFKAVDKADINADGVYVSADKVGKGNYFTFDDFTTIKGGNGSGKNLMAGAGQNGSKAIGLFMNQARDNPACINLQNSDGRYQVIPGKTYTLTAWFKPDDGMDLETAGDLYWGIRGYDIDSTYLSKPAILTDIYKNSVTLVAGDWVKVQVTFTGKANTGTTAYNHLSIVAAFSNRLATNEDGTAMTVDKTKTQYMVYLDNVTLQEVSSVGTYEQSEDSFWENDTITFDTLGDVKVTIQDYQYCAPTSVNVEVVTEQQDATVALSAAGQEILTQDFASYGAELSIKTYGSANKSTPALVTDFGHNDKQSVKQVVTAKQTNENNGRVAYTDDTGAPIALTVGKEYVFSAYFYFTEDFVTEACKVRLALSTNADTHGSPSTKEINVMTDPTNDAAKVGTVMESNTWIHMTYRFTATAPYAAIGVTTNDGVGANGVPSINGVVYIDDITFYELAQRQSFEGTFPKTYGDESYGTVVANSNTNFVHTGNKSAKYVIEQYGGSSLNPRVLCVDADNNAIELEIGQKYQVTAWVYADKAFHAKVRVRTAVLQSNMTLDGNNQYNVGNEITPFIQANTWQKITVTFTAAKTSNDAEDATLTYATFGLSGDNTATVPTPDYPVTVYVDDIFIEKIN